VRSWHLEIFARLFDLSSVWWCVLDILKFLPVYLILVPFGGAFLTPWTFCPFIWSLFRLVVRSWHLEIFARLFPFGGAILTSWTFCPFIWSLFRLVVRSWYFIIGTTGVRSCDLDNILKSEWDRDYRSSCDLDILNYELFGPFSGWLRSWYFAVHFLIIIFSG